MTTSSPPFIPSLRETETPIRRWLPAPRPSRRVEVNLDNSPMPVVNLLPSFSCGSSFKQYGGSGSKRTDSFNRVSKPAIPKAKDLVRKLQYEHVVEFILDKCKITNIWKYTGSSTQHRLSWSWLIESLWCDDSPLKKFSRPVGSKGQSKIRKLIISIWASLNERAQMKTNDGTILSSIEESGKVLHELFNKNLKEAQAGPDHTNCSPRLDEHLSANTFQVIRTPSNGQDVLTPTSPPRIFDKRCNESLNSFTPIFWRKEFCTTPNSTPSKSIIEGPSSSNTTVLVYTPNQQLDDDKQVCPPSRRKRQLTFDEQEDEDTRSLTSPSKRRLSIDILNSSFLTTSTVPLSDEEDVSLCGDVKLEQPLFPNLDAPLPLSSVKHAPLSKVPTTSTTTTTTLNQPQQSWTSRDIEEDISLCTRSLKDLYLIRSMELENGLDVSDTELSIKLQKGRLQSYQTQGGLQA